MKVEITTNQTYTETICKYNKLLRSPEDKQVKYFKSFSEIKKYFNRINNFRVGFFEFFDHDKNEDITTEVLTRLKFL